MAICFSTFISSCCQRYVLLFCCRFSSYPAMHGNIQNVTICIFWKLRWQNPITCDHIAIRIFFPRKKIAFKYQCGSVSTEVWIHSQIKIEFKSANELNFISMHDVLSHQINCGSIESRIESRKIPHVIFFLTK